MLNVDHVAALELEQGKQPGYRRLPDLIAARIVESETGLEVYGTDLDGSDVWIWIHRERG